MRALFSELYDFVIDQFTLFTDPFWNIVAIAAVGVIAFAVAWDIVGRLYRNGDICGSGCGSFIHWTIRIVAAVILLFLAAVLLTVVRFFLSVPGWAWFITLLAMGILLVIVLLIRRKRSDKEDKK